MIIREPGGQDLINRYKRNYDIGDNIEISEEMILCHWELEKDLARKLLGSTSQNRWETFKRCYTSLYSELYWLNQSEESEACDVLSLKRFSLWPEIIGGPPKKIFEVGPGRGELISYLANGGYMCRGMEITEERGENQVFSCRNLSWGVGDGIHLDQFEKCSTYDVVISNQVIEHMHPDDLVEHFTSVRSILADEGRFIFTTPHKYFGPSDISRVFKHKKPLGMHLKEYSYKELHSLLLQSGFKNVYAFFRMPQKLAKVTGMLVKPRKSSMYFWYLSAVESALSVVSKETIRKNLSIISKIILFPTNIFISAE